MDYYIQGGGVAKAAKIKAAFEKLGYDVKNWRFTTGVYYSLNGRIVNTSIGSNEYKLILNNPDYKELELPVEFKNGDIIGFNDCTHNDGSYVDWVGIYKRKSDNFRDQNQHLFHCVVTSMGTFRTGGLWRVFTAYPATKEQRELLFAKMREAGYQWDADKKELLSAVPKFKVGEWLAGIDDEGDMATEKIVSFSHNKVLLVDTDGCHTEYPKTELNGFRLWTIADAKDGDVLVCYSEVKGNPIEQAGIFKQYVGQHGGCSNTFLAHTGIDWDGNIIINGYMGSTNILPATKEQRELLFQKIKESGYEWDADKKELRKIQPHYDIANFHAGMPVLVRDYDNSRWSYAQFSHYVGECRMKFNACGIPYIQCIPFEGNEHLLGTTDMPSKEYINW